MHKLSILPPWLRADLFRLNLPNFFAAGIGILFGVSSRAVYAGEELARFANSLRGVFLYGDRLSPSSLLVPVFIPFLLFFLLAFTVYGRHITPAVFFFYALLRTSALCACIRAFSFQGLLYALALFCAGDLILLPGMCIAASLTVKISSGIFHAVTSADSLTLKTYLPDFLPTLLFPAAAALISHILVTLFTRLII